MSDDLNFLNLLMSAALGGTLESLASAAIERTPAVTERIRRTVSLVESQPPTTMEAAIHKAVGAARADLSKEYGGQSDLVKLLNHPPFAEEVTRKLLYRGLPDFDRLRDAYLNLPLEQHSQRWEALEPALEDFFNTIERYLLADKEMGKVIQGVWQIAPLKNPDEQIIIIAQASLEIQGYQARIAEATESSAGGIGQLIQLTDRQNATLNELVLLIRHILNLPHLTIEGNVIVERGDFVSRDVINRPSAPRGPVVDASVRAYLNSLRTECNRLPLAEELREAGSAKKQSPTLANVYVDLQVKAQPDLERVCRRLGVAEAELTDVLAQVKKWVTDKMPREMRQPSDKEAWQNLEMLVPRDDDDLADHPLMPYAKDRATLRQAVEKLTALESLAANRHLALLGDPGSGKSTFVNHLAVMAADQSLGNGPGDSLPGIDGPVLPLRVILRRWSARLTQDDEPGRELAYAALMQQTGLDRATLLQWLARPTTLVLFDGLDESPALGDGEKGVDRRKLLVESVADFCAAHDACRVLVTCRVKPYEMTEYQLPNLPDVTLAPLDPPRIQRFVHQWYTEAARLEPEPEQKAKAAQDERRLQKSLTERNDLKKMAGTPLLLTMLAAVNAWAGLPESRAELYEKCVEQLLWEWEKRKRTSRDERDEAAGPGEMTSLLDLLHQTGLRRVDFERVLWQQTYMAHGQDGQTQNAQGQKAGDGDPPPVDLPIDTVRKALAAIHPGKRSDGWAWAEEVVGLMAERGGLLVENEPGTFTFPHRTFQEYLAARWLLETENRAVEAATLARSDFWREVVLLACGYLSYEGRYSDVQGMIAELCGGTDVGKEEDRRRLMVAGTAWQEFGPERAVGHVGQQLQAQIPRQLTALMQDRTVPAQERLTAGLLLADLGILPPDLDAFVPIPAKDELGYDFQMGKYPITNSQYRLFFDEGGYNGDKPWWTEEAVKDIERWSSKEDWRNGPRYWNDSRFNRATQPVVGVSWYEAVAYCEWLTERLRANKTIRPDEKVRLPTEAEWMRAALGAPLSQTGRGAGGEGERYPWGPDFNPAFANTKESGLGQTTPVHMYPQGATPEGVWDLAGNVWEWSLDRDTDGLPWLKGGSWVFAAEQARASARFGANPWLRFSYYGFRVVVVPISR